MQTVLELQQENAEIRTRLLAQEALMATSQQTPKSKDRLIEQLKEALILARHRQFAKATESLRSLQSELFDEAELSALSDTKELSELPDSASDHIEVPAHCRKKGGRKKLPEDLSRQEVVYDLDDADKVCDQGHTLIPMSDKVSEQLDIIPMQIQVIRHICKQYHCPCCDGAIKVAKKPKQPIEKSQASAGLLSYIAVSKYADSLPLYRQSQILKRFDIEMNRTTLATWMIKCGELIQPVINRLEERLLAAPFVHMDETPVQVLNEAGKSAESKSYMWVRCAGPPGQRVVLLDYDPNRSGFVPTRLLQDYEGALMVDGYEGYNAVCQMEKVTRLGCWVHARRKFVEADKVSKKKNSQSAYAIQLIAKLYQIEKAHKASDPAQRHQARQTQSKAQVDKLRTWLDETLA